MSKLDDLRNKLAEKKALRTTISDKLPVDFLKLLAKLCIEDYSAGWDAAMSLRLPSKFLKWVAFPKNYITLLPSGYLVPTVGTFETEDDLFNYWIENIYSE